MLELQLRLGINKVSCLEPSDSATILKYSRFSARHLILVPCNILFPVPLLGMDLLQLVRVLPLGFGQLSFLLGQKLGHGTTAFFLDVVPPADC